MSEEEKKIVEDKAVVEDAVEKTGKPEEAAQIKEQPKETEGAVQESKKQEEIAPGPIEDIDRVVKISRVSKVVKGGKNFSFSAMVVAGNGNGEVGVGFGKSNEVVGAIVKGTSEAKSNYRKINLKDGTIPHEIIGEYKASRVLLKPAGAGTGVIAGGSVRAVCDAVGIKDILTKSLGSRNAINVVKATMNGLLRLRLKRRG